LEGKKIDVVGVLAPHPFELNWHLGMEHENENYGFDISHFDAQLDPVTMSDVVDSSISRGVDLIIISPVDAVTASPVVERSQAAGIPIITMFTPTELLPDMAFPIDYYAVGAMAAEFLAEQIDYNGEVAAVTGDFTTPSGVGRVKAFEDVMATYPDIEVVDIVDAATAPWSRQGAYAATQGILAAHPDVDGIFGIDDELAFGVILAVEEAGKSDEIIVIGSNGDTPGFEAIRDGKSAGTIVVSPYQIGRDAIIAAGWLLSSPCYQAGTLQGVKWAELTPMTIDNIDEVQWPPAG
jgi:ribose transport system substrate-binding protein